MRLGQKEKELLFEIEQSPGDLFLGFLLSAASTKRAYQIANNITRNRIKQKQKMNDLTQRRKRLIARLEAK